MEKLDIDYLTELEPYFDRLHHYKIRGNKLQACSPFRDEKTPSFAVNLDTGTWVDSGATDDRYYKGHFVALLSFLRGETWEDTDTYLLEIYGSPTDPNKLELLIGLNLPKERYFIESKALELLAPFSYRHPYLERRGISEAVQRAFKIGYDRENNGISIPWLDRNGRLVNIKFRSINYKYFWYLENGLPIKQQVYGLHIVDIKKCDAVWIVESEIDAMYLWSNSIPAVALGGASISQRQIQLLMNSSVKQFVIATDNDMAGRRVGNTLKSRLAAYALVSEIVFPPNIKDINDMTVNQLNNVEIRHITSNFLASVT